MFCLDNLKTNPIVLLISPGFSLGLSPKRAESRYRRLSPIWGRAICPVVRNYYIWVTDRRKGVLKILIWGRAICPVVWSYYIWDTGRKKGNWGISWIISFLMKNERKMKEQRKFWFSFFPVGDSQKSKRVFWEVYAWLGVLVKVGTLFFHQVGQIWVWWALDLPDLCGIARSTIWAWFQGLFF